MKKSLPVLLTLAFILLACTPPGTTAPPPGPNLETMVAMTLEALTVAAPPPTVAPPTQSNATNISYNNVSFLLSHDLATNALAGSVPAVAPTTDGPGWDVAPEYIKFKLDNYAQFSGSHEAQILVYPAAEYASVNESAARGLDQLRAILNGSAAPTADNLPAIPYFNAGQVFAAQIQTLQFRNGSGVRFLTEYAQYVATANNADLFYEFQGLTTDGKYYIIAILPISHPLLAYDANPDINVPTGGIPFPGVQDQNTITNYYTSVVGLLNSAAPNSYSPTLTNLDALVQSITVTP